MESTVLYSGKSLITMQEDGGLGHWPANAERLKRCEYMVVVRNMREHLANRDVGHGTAFMIAKVSGVIPSIHLGRNIITFNQYSLLNIPDAWKTITRGQRFPLAYHPTESLLQILKIEPDKLEWLTLNPSIVEVPKRASSGMLDVVQDAKINLANLLGINSSQIDIKLTF